MAVTAYLYASFFLALANKEIDLLDDSIKVALTTSAYTPNQDTHNYFDDVTNEVTGTGYSAGGAAIANDTFALTNNVAKYDGDDVAWAASTITARRAVIYDDTPALATAKPLIGWIDFGQDEISSSGTFTIQFNASGIFTITCSDAAGFP